MEKRIEKNHVYACIDGGGLFKDSGLELEYVL